MTHKCYLDARLSFYSNAHVLFQLKHEKVTKTHFITSHLFLRIRIYLNYVTAVAIAYSILTEVPGNVSSNIEFVKDFAAFVIIVELDNIIFDSQMA